VKVAPVPEVLTEIGELEAVTYATKKGKEPITSYTHDFGEEGGKRPRLTYDPKARKLHIVGGSYKIEDRGIVD
jgi:hypothetical protein